VTGGTCLLRLRKSGFVGPHLHWTSGGLCTSQFSMRARLPRVGPFSTQKSWTCVLPALPSPITLAEVLNGESAIFAGCPPRGAAPSGMASGSSDAGNVCPWPASILLAEEAYVAASRNDTTARARSKDNHTVEITFWIVDPPAVSFYTFHCIKAPNSDSKDVDLRVNSVVAGAHGRFLIRTLLAGDDQDEYFIYKGHPKSPSLESIPLIPYHYRLHGAEFGIVPRGDDGHYLLIALRGTVNENYRLHIYSSEDTTWTTKELPNPCPEVGAIMPDKVFTLGDGLVLWVDLLQGIVTCDILKEPHRAQYNSLPEPLPENREKSEEIPPRSWAFSGCHLC